MLDTTGLSGVIAHNPGDMTVSVHAGTPLRALAEELAPHGQHVAFDAARVADGATVGGLFATADSGPSALVYGSLRDLVIGVTMVLADGTVARSGGHVIKNVAGYDLAKLLHGSLRHAGVLVEVVLRLHPVPKATATVAVDCPLTEAAELAATVLGWPARAGGPGVDPDPAGDGTLLVRLEGTRDALPARTEAPRGRPAPALRRVAGERKFPASRFARGCRWRSTEARRSGSGRPRTGAADADPGRGMRRSPGGPRPTGACCGSGCGRAAAPGAGRAAGHRDDRGAGHRGRHRDPRAGGGGRGARDRARCRRHVDAADPAGRRELDADPPAWGPPPSALPVLADSRPSWTRTGASAPAASTPGRNVSTPAGSAETNLPQNGPSAFDEHRPPPRELLDDCVHCGFCLPTCPTYQLWGEEMDSPRGRIYLMNLAEKGEIGLEGRSRSTSTPAWAAWPA